MPLAVKNNTLIVKGGRLTEDCDCCKTKEACGSIAGSGGPGTTADTYSVPSRQLTIQLNYDAFSVPDQFIVRAGGETYIDTGPVSGAGTPKFCKPDGVEEIEVEVQGPEGTAWVYSISCPDDDTTPKDVTEATISPGCPPAFAEYDGDLFVYARVCFNYPSLDGGCAPPLIKYEFKFCVYDNADQCIEQPTWFATESGGYFDRERAYPVSAEEIALFGHTDNGKPCMLIWITSPKATQKAGVRIYAINQATGDKSDGVLAAFIEPASFACDFFDQLGQPGRETSYSPAPIGGGLFSYSGTLSQWPDPGDCPRKLGAIIAEPHSVYAANPTFNAGWTVVASDVWVANQNDQIQWAFNGVALVGDDYLVFAIQNPCGDLNSPLIIATGAPA
jgi:hypothetical protein